MRELCNIDGRIVPVSAATVPVMDRGFLFGDSVYEVMRTLAGVPLAWPEHLARLRASADGLLLQIDLDDGDILRRMRTTLDAAGAPGAAAEAYVRIIVTRGVGTAPSIDLAAAGKRCTWVILVRPFTPPAQDRIKLAIVDRLRVDRRALDPALKSGNYLNNVLALAEAKQRGADDCVMVNTGGMVAEASTSNLFAVIGGVVRTPPLTAGILAGVTRGLLLELCRREGIAVAEDDLAPAELRRADEVFLSSTLRDVLPATELDGKPVGNGQIGPVTARLRTRFAGYLSELVRTRDEPGWRRLTEPRA